jgi:hypothetical protein
MPFNALNLSGIKFDKVAMARLLILLFLASCISNVEMKVDPSSVPASSRVRTTPKYSIYGSVNGLDGSFIIAQGNKSTTIDNNGYRLLFSKIPSGTAVDLEVTSHPPNEYCQVSNGTGGLTADKTDVTINCALAYSISPTLSGMINSNLELQGSWGGEDYQLEYTTNGTQSFAVQISTGLNYSLSIPTQPLGNTCGLTNETGTAGPSEITNISISCTPTDHNITPTINGLIGTVTLQNNGADDLVFSTNGSASFSTQITHNDSYSVSITSQPAGQVCSVNNGSGVVNGTDVEDISVDCVSNQYNLNPTVTGLVGTLTLQNNDGDDLLFLSDGSSTFTTQMAHGDEYDVTIASSPEGQTCNISNGSGTINAADVNDIAINCSTNTYEITPSVTGVTSGTLVLQNNGGDDLNITTNGNFTFSSQVPYNQNYEVKVASNPIGKECLVSNGAGTIASANITNISVTCSDTTLRRGALCNTPFSGPTFHSGQGTLADPYIICNPTQLNQLRNFNTSAFLIDADIDLSNESFDPIASFSGLLDGGGYKLLNWSYTLDSISNISYWGFFREFINAELRHLEFENFTLIVNGFNNDHNAIVAGRAAGARFEHLKIEGSVSSQSQMVAGLIGSLDDGQLGGALINDISLNVNLSGGGVVGGLIGKINNFVDVAVSKINVNGGTISRNSSSIDQSNYSQDKIFAGLIAEVRGASQIYVNEVSLNNTIDWDSMVSDSGIRAGGVIAFIGKTNTVVAPPTRFSLYNIYSNLTFSSIIGGHASQYQVGGAIAWSFDDSTGNVFNSLFVGDATGLTNVPNMHGFTETLGAGTSLTYDNSYFNTDSFGTNTCDGAGCILSSSSGETTSDLQSNTALYTNWSSDIWDTSGVGSSQYPQLYFTSREFAPCLETKTGTDYHSGIGTLSDPYIVCNATEFANINNNLSSHYILGQNIQLSGYTSRISGEFSGTLDGRGHKLSDFGDSTTVDNGTSLNRYGLFEYVTGDKIENLILDNFEVRTRGYSDTACFIGEVGPNVRIANIVLKGSVCTGNTLRTGGLIGYAASSTGSVSLLNIEINDTRVSGRDGFGVLVGQTQNTFLDHVSIKNSFVERNSDDTSATIFNERLGMVIGHCQNSLLVKRLYSDVYANVTGIDQRIGGLCGSNSGIGTLAIEDIVIDGVFYGDATGATLLGGLVGEHALNTFATGSVDDSLVNISWSLSHDISASDWGQTMGSSTDGLSFTNVFSNSDRGGPPQFSAAGTLTLIDSNPFSWEELTTVSTFSDWTSSHIFKIEDGAYPEYFDYGYRPKLQHKLTLSIEGIDSNQTITLDDTTNGYTATFTGSADQYVFPYLYSNGSDFFFGDETLDPDDKSCVGTNSSGVGGSGITDDVNNVAFLCTPN